MHASSLELMRRFAAEHLTAMPAPLKLLDVGSYDVNGSYRPLFGPHVTYTGLDVAPGPGVDVVADPYAWPFPDQHFDAVISGQALEHIEYPWLTISEIARVLRPGGLACLIAPRDWPEHRYPIDCWRFLTDGMTALAKWASLEIISATTTPPDSILIARRPTPPLPQKK